MWVFDGARHRIIRDAEQVPDGAIVLAFFARLGSTLKAKMLLAALWSGHADVIIDRMVWRRELTEEAGHHADSHAIGDAIDGAWRCARALDVEGVVQAITRYHRLVEEGRRVRAKVERILYDEDDEPGLEGGGALAVSTPC